MMGLRQKRNVNGDDVRFGKELIEAHVFGVGDGGDPLVGRVGVIAQDLHWQITHAKHLL